MAGMLERRDAMITLKRMVITAASVIAMSFGMAAPAGAAPGDPCQLAVTLLCRFVPIAPDLDHDIDLTKDPGTLNGQSLPAMPSADPKSDDAPPTDPCLNGCV
jgi:hypothetical protein